MARHNHRDWCRHLLELGIRRGLLYSQGRTSFAGTSNGCAALVMSAAVGYWLAILAGISVVIGVFQRVRRTRGRPCRRRCQRDEEEKRHTNTIVLDTSAIIDFLRKGETNKRLPRKVSPA